MMNTTGELAETLMQPPAPIPGQTFAALASDLLARVENGQPIVETIPTGWGLLDDTVGGLIRGEYAGLVASPGVGKSTLADRLIVDALRRNPATRAIVLSLETSPAIRVARLAAHETVKLDETNAFRERVPLGAIQRGDVRALDWLREAVARLTDDIGHRLRFVDDVYEAQAVANLIRSEGPDLVEIDHMGLLTADAVGDNEVARFDAALGEVLKALKESNAAGLLIGEVNKTALNAGHVGMGAFRGSARFASLAAVYIGLRPEDDDTGPADEGEAIAADLTKNRYGVSFRTQRGRLFGCSAFFSWKPGLGRTPRASR